MRKIKWSEIYLLMYELKSTVGIYFMAFVFFYLFYGVFDNTISQTLDFWTVIQMFSACMLIGFGQGLFQLRKYFTIPRILLWGLMSMIVTIGFSEFFNWFDSYPVWYRIVFYSIILISFVLMLLTLYWQLQKETKNLNEALRKYKESRKVGDI
ncbi:MAG TPA: hypothetical protein GX505_13680 [Clostridiales bacterium]|nr:hypothetical protein [Clostridiales bacterium]